MNLRTWWTIHDDVIDFEQELEDEEEIFELTMETAIETLSRYKKEKTNTKDHFENESSLFEI